MNREQASKLLHKKMKNKNLRNHCYAVEAVMTALCKKLVEKPSAELVEAWGIAGLIHDVDYEEVKDTAKVDHTIVALKWLEELDASTEIKNAIARHAWNYVENSPKPETKMDWALYTCDELTGFIVACALVRPEKKLSSVKLSSIKKKWNKKGFAAGVHREQIEMCEEKLNIKLDDFIEIALTAMQEISSELGL